MTDYNLTKIGLIFFVVSMIITIINASVLFFIEASNSIASLGLMLVSGIGGILLLVAFIILWVAGIGLKEYGEKHSKFCLISMILFFVAIGVIIAVAVFQSFMMASSIIKGDYSSFKNFYFLTPLAAIFMGIVYLFLLHELEDAIGKIVLYISFILMIVVSIIIAYLGYIGFDEWISSLDTLESSDFLMQGQIGSINSFSQAFQTRANQLNILSVIPNSLFLASVILPLYRISTGKLKKIPKKNKICAKCGYQIDPNSEFCPNCGLRF